ncbi:MAG TPA: large conductance mechanosensitive channel protein MscL [Candidatus Omnitrophica bacterium]|nr:large conductance mechanosensitive channel protein MscL [Candidatus Omnitrophota bacterium]
MKVLQEFKDFAMKGNVVDMAVGVIIGGAFGKIVSSLVNDLIMPPIGKLLGGVDFSSLFIDMSGVGYVSLAEAQKAGAATINYGVFLNTVINFLIVAFCLFMVIKGMNTMKKKEAAKPGVPVVAPRNEILLEEIRDLLKKK